MTGPESRTFMEQLSSLEDEGVVRLWDHFANFCSMPRPSGSESSVVEYFVRFAETHEFDYEVDNAGNVLIKISATVGFENAPGLLLQGHSDMVDVMVEDAPRNPTTDGVLPFVSDDGEWLGAIGTSLGADNGIGLSAALAILRDDIPHGPLGVLVTVDEERGLRGAREVRFDLSRYRFMVNLDSESEGEMTIGCAGGEDTVISFPVETTQITSNSSLVSLKLSGLKGGHSGVDIGLVGRERANAIKLIAQVLHDVREDVDFSLVDIEGGTKRNIIPSESEVVLAVDHGNVERIIEIIETRLKGAVQQYSGEDGFKYEIKNVDEIVDSVMFTSEATSKALAVLASMPNGVQMWSEIEEVPETSTNLAIVDLLEGNLVITLMTRSTIDEGIKNVQAEISSVVEEVQDVGMVNEGGYPGWKPNPQSQLVDLVQKAYKELTGKKLAITATHGGLECGLLGGRYSHLEMVSIGPDIENAHSVHERVNIQSVVRFYDLLKGIVGLIAGY